MHYFMPLDERTNSEATVGTYGKGKAQLHRNTLTPHLLKATPFLLRTTHSCLQPRSQQVQRIVPCVRIIARHVYTQRVVVHGSLRSGISVEK